MSRMRRFVGIVALGGLLLGGLVVGLRWMATPAFPPPVEIPVGAAVTAPQVSVWGDHAFLLAPDGRVWFWGQVNSVPLLNAHRAGLTGTNLFVPRPVALEFPCRWREFAGWSDRYLGRTAEGTWMSLNGPDFQPQPLPGVWRSAAFGMGHRLLVAEDGGLWGAGDNLQGQLGLGSPGPKVTTLQPVGTNTDWVAVITGDFDSAGLRGDGTLWRWGLGFGPPSGRVPLPADRTRDWMRIVAGDFGGMGQKRDGSLWAWGPNLSVMIRGGAAAQGPARLGPGTNWVSFACGSQTMFAVKGDGTLWVWGPPPARGFMPQSPSAPDRPRRIGDRADWVAVFGRSRTLVGITRDGGVWQWGERIGRAPELVGGLFGRGAVPMPPLTTHPELIARFVTNALAGGR